MSRQIGVRRRYSDETLREAVELVKSKSISLRQAASAYHIPKSTLSNKVNDKTAITCRPGPLSVLTHEEETRLVEWASNMARIGFGRTKSELLDTVKKILDRDGRVTPFRENRPGKDWYYAFLKRHPVLSMRSPQQLAKERAVISPERVGKWFSDFKYFMDTEILEPSIWKDPSRWYNADESGFPLCPRSGKVLAPRGLPNVYNFTSSDKTQMTVLACMSANGHFMKPFIVFPGQRFSYNPLDGFPDAYLGRSDNGWMDSELFVSWLREVFVPGLEERSVKKPVVLFVDGHSTHATLEASEFCRANNIILYCLLEHASHLLQPCDLKLFSSLKEAWKLSVRQYQAENIGEYLTKSKFAGVFKKAWERSTAPELAIKGFKSSGLFPFDPSQVLGTLKMEPSRIFTFKEQQTASSTPDSTETNLSSPNEADVPNDIAVTPQVSAATETNLSSPNEADVPNDISVTPRVSAAFNILEIPKAARARVQTKTRIQLPKAISGDRFRQLLLDRKRKREEEEQKKEERKKERAEKKIAKLEEQERKKKAVEEKKKIREEKKKEREIEKKERDLVKLMKKGKKRTASESTSEEDMPKLDDNEEVDMFMKKASTSCYACEKPYDNNPENWIMCHNCPRWLHRSCVSTIDLLSMTEGQIADLEFECDYC